MQKRYTFAVLAVSLMLPGVAGASTVPVTADSPSSRCVTATSITMHANAAAAFAKDIASREKNATYAAAITKYRNALDIAWAAMNDQYCGFGAYGAASAIKSYGKSIERARAAFLSDVTHPGDVKVTTSTVATSDEKVEPKETAPAPKASERAVSVASPKARFHSGWHRGMHAESIKDLQKFLAEHFKMKADDSIVTGFFGPKTEGLVKKFQMEKHIITSEDDGGAGLVGPRTTASLNAED